MKQTESATLDRQGRVINPCQKAMQSKIAAIANCPWVDHIADLCKFELVGMIGTEEKISVIDQSSMAAFNFKKYGHDDDLEVNKDSTKVEDSSTINSKDQGGTSLADHTQYMDTRLPWEGRREETQMMQPE